ncbi:MAG TPA: TolC family protein, partial [Planctomycetota bacterium]|nr:TolC family protein [Planctomycetota bacterium]
MKLPRIFLVCATLAGCQSSTELENSADRAAEEILREKSANSVDRRAETVLLPKSKPAPPPPSSSEEKKSSAPENAGGQGATGIGAAQAQSTGAQGETATGAQGAQSTGAQGAQGATRGESPAPPAPAQPPRVLTLHEALEIAVQSGRDYTSRKESLYLIALGLTGTRYDFGPRLTAALSYTFADSDAGDPSQGVGATAGVAQRLPWGGAIALDASQNFANTGFTTSPLAFSSGVGIALTQPLLRGFGSEIANEALTQAERSTLYAIRDFELFREDYSISVASSYYDLVQQKQTVENQRRNMENLAEERRKAEALFQVGRKPELELLRAKRSELTSKNALIEAEESLRLALDRFRIFLGLPASDRVDVRPEEPSFVAIDYDVNSAIECALANRLDFLNQKEQLEDAARSLRISKNGLLPDLTLTGGVQVGADSDATFLGQQLDRDSYSAALSLSLPVDRTLDRNAWKAARIRYQQELRGFELFKDELIVSVQSTFRQLERQRQSVEIQNELIVDQEKNLRIAQLLFEQGDNSNRDV